MRAFRKKSNKIEKCFNCRKTIKKGNWMWLHDNVCNKINPKCFCSRDCKLDFISNILNHKTLDKFFMSIEYGR